MEPTSKPTKKQKSIKTKIAEYIRQAIAIIFWVYVIIKLFVFDIDIFLINKIDPSSIWLVKYKFFIAIGILAAIWIIAKTKNVLLWIAYIILYPLIVIFWKIPYFIFKQKSWILAFALANALISFFKSIRYNFIVCAIFFLSLFSVIVFENKVILWYAISGLCVILLLTYIRSFIFVFKPSSIFQLYSKLLKQSPNFVFEKFTDKTIAALPTENLTETQLQTRRTNIQTMVISNRALLFISKKLQAYQDSKLNYISYIFNILLLIILTVISFAGINYALFKIDPTLFALSGNTSYFTFIFYSFRTFLFGSIEGIISVEFYSQLASMVEQGFSMLTGLILISLFFSAKNEKNREELSKTINEIKTAGENVEGLISTEYRIDITQAFKEIQELKGNAMTFILWLSKDI